MNPKPVRIQRSRKKGARLVSPNGLPLVCVTRGTKWGNPFGRAMEFESWIRDGNDYHYFSLLVPRPHIDELNRRRAAIIESLPSLRGKNLACWCKDGPCHADILLGLANSEGGAPTSI